MSLMQPICMMKMIVFWNLTKEGCIFMTMIAHLTCKAMSQVVADEVQDMKILLVVTDCKGAYEHFVGEKVIVRSDRARWGRYNKRKTRLEELKSKFEEVAFGRVLRDDPTMGRVDNAARVHRESVEK